MTLAPSDGRVSRGLRTRQTILDAAIDLLRLEGAAALTHRAIAARAGTSLAATTYHFDTLDDLLVAAFEQLTERTVDQVTAISDAVLRGERGLVDAAVEFAETVDPQHGFGADGLVELAHASINHERLRVHVGYYVQQMSRPFAALIGEDASITLVHAFTGVLMHHRTSVSGTAARAELRADLTRLFDTFGLTRAVTNRLEEELS
jgi:DNA-binding transcriptional regulator YbjK